MIEIRVWDISLFLFIFNLSLGFVSGLGILNGFNYSGVEYGGVSADVFANNSLNDLGMSVNKINPETGSLPAGFSYLNAAYQFIIVGIPTLFSIIINVIAGIYLIMTTIGVPAGFAFMIQTIVWIIELIGLWQLFTGRSFREQQ